MLVPFVLVWLPNQTMPNFAVDEGAVLLNSIIQSFYDNSLIFSLIDVTNV
jgi:hypothetical protein